MFSRDAIAILLIYVPACAFSQTAVPQTRTGHLSRVADLYVSANEFMLAFDRSKCGYVIKHKTPSTDILIRTELLSAFPAAAQEESLRVLAAVQPKAKAQGEELVQQVIAMVQREHKGSKRLACGFAAGMAAATHAGARNRWQSEVMRLRQSDR